MRFGLGLIPARLLPELKVSVAQATEPCTNLRIASLIYLRARQMVAATSRSPAISRLRRGWPTSPARITAHRSRA